MAKKKLSTKDAKESISLLKEFNRLSKGFIKLLDQQVTTQRKKVSTLSIMVSEIKIPENKNRSVNVQMIDLKNTKGTKKGKGLFSQKMDWEKDIESQNKGIIL
tara:strand:+ start:200 stop:508 length:309 start_codon:yes stop_codon:yes gene_type:complete